jgi:hypothetical protein
MKGGCLQLPNANSKTPSGGHAGDFFFSLMGLGFELRALNLQSRGSPTLLCLFWRWDLTISTSCCRSLLAEIRDS